MVSWELAGGQKTYVYTLHVLLFYIILHRMEKGTQYHEGEWLEGNLRKSVLSTHHKGPGDQTQNNQAWQQALSPAEPSH